MVIIEVCKSGKTIGYVVAQDMVSSVDMIVNAFPQVDRVKVAPTFPKYDDRCKKIAQNIYAWA